jgi:hypothetical protein
MAERSEASDNGSGHHVTARVILQFENIPTLESRAEPRSLKRSAHDSHASPASPASRRGEIEVMQSRVVQDWLDDDDDDDPS